MRYLSFPRDLAYFLPFSSRIEKKFLDISFASVVLEIWLPATLYNYSWFMFIIILIFRNCTFLSVNTVHCYFIKASLFLISAKMALVPRHDAFFEVKESRLLTLFKKLFIINSCGINFLNPILYMLATFLFIKRSLQTNIQELRGYIS